MYTKNETLKLINNLSYHSPLIVIFVGYWTCSFYSSIPYIYGVDYYSYGLIILSLFQPSVVTAIHRSEQPEIKTKQYKLIIVNKNNQV